MDNESRQDWLNRIDVAIAQLASQDLMCDIDYIYLRRQNVEKMAMQLSPALSQHLEKQLDDAVISAHGNIASRCLRELKTLTRSTQKNIEKLYLTCIAHFTWLDNQQQRRDGFAPDPKKVSERTEMVWNTAVSAAKRVGLELANFNDQMRIMLDTEVKTLVSIKNAMFGVPVNEIREQVMVVSAVKNGYANPKETLPVPQHLYSWVVANDAR